MSGELNQVVQLWQEAGEQIPRWADVIFAAVGLYGIFLWLFGSRLVRPSLALLGVILGGVGGLFLPESWFGGIRLIAILIPAILIGLLYFVTWRFWIAIILALSLGGLLPWGLLVYQGQLTWDGQEIEMVEVENPKTGENIRVPITSLDRFSPSDGARSLTPEERELVIEAARSLDEVLRQLVVAVNDWFWEISPSIRWTVIVLGVIGTVAGLSIGLALPTLAAAAMTALAGSMLFVIAIYRLQGSVLSFAADWIPDQPGAYFHIVLIATLTGTFIQWGWVAFGQKEKAP